MFQFADLTDDLTPNQFQMLRTFWTFKGKEYHFTYPVTREWARWYLKNREGVKGI